MINVSNLVKSHKDGPNTHKVLDGASFQISKGESLAVTGESGSGKSTLLHLVATLDKPDSGSITVNDQDVTQFSERQADNFRRAQIGIVFQRFNLIDCLTVEDNIALPARLSKRYDEDYLEGLTNQLGIISLAHRLPGDLSGGEQQRVAIARALAHKPDIVLADEPTGNLDDKNSDRVARLLFDTCASLNTSLLLVTHSQAFAEMAHNHVVLRQGTLHCADG